MTATRQPTATQIFGDSLLDTADMGGRSGIARPDPVARRVLPGWLRRLGADDQFAHLGALAGVSHRLHRDAADSAAARALLERPLDARAPHPDRRGRLGADKFDSELMDQVQNTEDAYWGLIAAQDSTRVAEKSLETAKALLEQTQAQYEVGVVSRVEVVQAEAGVADREFKSDPFASDRAQRAGCADRPRAGSLPGARVRDHRRGDGSPR